jgi:hypothetical protein
MRESTHNLIHLFMCLMAKRFGEALSEEASKRIKNAVLKTTQYKTQWGIRIFESWKSERTNDDGPAETCNFGLDVSVVESLKNFWLHVKIEVRD